MHTNSTHRVSARAAGLRCSTIPATFLTVFIFLSAPFAAAQWSTNPNFNNAIATVTGNQAVARSVSDGAGGAIITWYDFRSETNYDIYAQRINASGVVQWTADGAAICTAVNSQFSPTLTSDNAGGAIITWQDGRGGTTYDIYAQRINASGVVQWTANGVPICTATNDQASPILTSDNAGGAIITWQDFRTGTNYDIYAQRINASGIVQWTANGVPMCTAANSQYSPAITSDNAGGAIITWYDFRIGTYNDIYARRINASGVAQWTADGVAICTAANYQYTPTLTSDNAGGAIITWYDYRSGTNYDIYAQLINVNGVVQWTADGAAICTAANSQYNPTITSDPANGGTGGAIITWYDSRSGTSNDIYAQRISTSGAAQWTANGVAICTAANSQDTPAITIDNAGGAIITWPDFRSGTNYDIYAQRINVNGVVLWTVNGVAISTAANSQDIPTITSDNAGGAIIAWQDTRGTTSDIYAQKVDYYGYLSNVAPRVADLVDVINDQGGMLKLTWTRSYLDVSPTNGIYNYFVFRGTPASLAPQGAMTISREEYLDKLKTNQGLEGFFFRTEISSDNPTEIYWQNVATLAAYRLPAYSYFMTTMSDSGLQGIPWYYGMVMAQSVLGEFFESNPDSAYSKDNLPPGAPANALLVALNSTSNNVTWDRNRVDTDVAEYYVYRSTYTGFPVTDSTRIAMVSDTTFLDSGLNPSVSYIYRITTVDVHGNQSVPTGEIALAFTQSLANGWNMISLPSDPSDAYYRTLYPSSVTGTLYGFNNGYYSTDTLRLGKGYWLKSSSSSNAAVSGSTISSQSLSLSNGWNMIGGISCAVPVSGIFDPAGIVVAGTLYGFNNGYTQTDTIRRGKGYWIRTRAAGSIWLNCGSAMAKPSTEFVSTSFPTLEIQDVTGASQTLSFNVALKNPEEKLSYSLPGLPPSGAFDARFSGDSRISETEGGVIQLQSNSYPVTVTAGNLPSTIRYMLTERRNGVDGATHTLVNGASVQITNPEVKTLRLQKQTEQSAPLVFALEQNYPNPFNPSTTIKFSVEKTDRATVEVYNLLGEKVMTLFDEVAEAGQSYQIKFSAKGGSASGGDGASLASGVYLYKLQSGKRSELKKLVLLK